MARRTHATLVVDVRARHAKGTTAGPTHDPRYMQAAIRTAAAFEQAIARHRPKPYDGDAYVLSSHQRMQDGDALSLRRIFTGRCKRYEVGATHAQSLDPRNPVFASTLRRCVELIRAAAASALDAAGTASLPAEGPIVAGPLAGLLPVLWPACCRSFVGLLPALTIVA